MVVLILVGMPGSGKDIFVQEAGKIGFSHIRMGDMVRLFAGEAGIGTDDMAIGGFASAHRAEYGPEIWAKRTLEKMPRGNVLIDGSRSLAEIDHFKSFLGGDIKVIGIDAPTEMRFQRLVTRGRGDDPSILEDFQARDNRELSWGLGEALENADITICNNGTLKEFRNECQAIINNIIRKHRKP
ncbi:MAG: flagellar hook-basal body complex protein FliE [Thermoplasmata archaeon]|nr:flagellar hook-basal body complex protein FliE [Thermoplasmata archaeon]